jgi:4-amino-4-deoxy-L-arabinose transferase-like glycosyltransferase
MSIHVWRQTQTQSTIVNFYEEDMNIFNPRRNDRGDSDGILRMEFPLMQWLVAIQYKVFGNHLIISRLFMFIIGLLSVFGIYKLLDELFDNNIISIMGAWAFNFSPSFYYYTINPMPDNLALCFAIWGITLFFRWYNNTKMVNLIFSGVLLSLAALCKLPFIIYYIIPFIYFVLLVFKNGMNRKILFQSIFSLSFSILPIAWYLIVLPSWGENIIKKGILIYNDSFGKLLDYFQHNLISTLPELLLNYGSLPLFLAGFYFLIKRKAYRDSRFVLLLSLSIIVLFYYLFEANAIAKIHDYYLFPFYPLLFILVSYGAYYLYNQKKRFFRYLTIILLLILPITCYLRMQNRWDPDSPGFNKDLLDYKTELRNAVPKDALVIAGNDISHFIFFYYIDKKGWGFDSDHLTINMIESMIDKGAEYLYTDSDEIINNPEMVRYLGQPIFEKGTIKIFRLNS